MANSQEGDFSWTHEKTFKLIFMFEKLQLLYNSRLVDYKDKNKRSEAVAELAKTLETTDAEITKKLRGLRSQYAREKSKEQYPVPGSMVDGEPYKSRWAYYPYLHFLDEFTIVKKSRSFPQDSEVRHFNQQTYHSNENHFETFIHPSSEDFHGFLEETTMPPTIKSSPGHRVNSPMNRVTSPCLGTQDQNFNRESSVIHRENSPINRDTEVTDDSDEVEIEVTCDSPEESSRASPPAKRKKLEKRESHLLEKAFSLIERLSSGSGDGEWGQDGDVLFGKYVTHELKQIDDVQAKSLLKNKIQNLIFEAQCSLQSSSTMRDGLM